VHWGQLDVDEGRCTRGDRFARLLQSGPDIGGLVVNAKTSQRLGQFLTSTLRRWRTAPSNSMALRPNEPSPCKTITGLSGFATLAPTLNCMPTPIVPNVPELRRCPATNVGMTCRPWLRISCLSTQRMFSRSMNSRISPHSCNGSLVVEKSDSRELICRNEVSSGVYVGERDSHRRCYSLCADYQLI